MGVYHLFIDELGNPDPKVTREEHYIICGCSMPDEQRDKAKVLADQIKFKYWGRTNIVFHSREVGKNEGSFAILRVSHYSRLSLLRTYFSSLEKLALYYL